MIKVKGCLAGSTKYSILRPVSMEAYWADQEYEKLCLHRTPTSKFTLWLS